MRLIDADRFLDQIEDQFIEHDLTRAQYIELEDRIMQQPTVEIQKPAEPKRGEWIERESYAEDKEDGFETTIACSCCDFPATIFYFEDGESRMQIRTDYCPHCGARMEEGVEE